MNKCEICGEDNEFEDYFEDESTGKIICLNCMLEEQCTTEKLTRYYDKDGEYLGDDDDLDEVIEYILSRTYYKDMKGRYDGIK